MSGSWELTRLTQKCQLSGSVFITWKQYGVWTKPIPRQGSVEGFELLDNQCLFRAPDGKEISTTASSKEVKEFQMAYSNLLGVNRMGWRRATKRARVGRAKQHREGHQIPCFHQLITELLFFLWFLLLATKLSFWLPYNKFSCEMRVILDGRRAVVFTG